jgi:hypothetical protein
VPSTKNVDFYRLPANTWKLPISSVLNIKFYGTYSASCRVSSQFWRVLLHLLSLLFSRRSFEPPSSFQNYYRRRMEKQERSSWCFIIIDVRKVHMTRARSRLLTKTPEELFKTCNVELKPVPPASIEGVCVY